MKRKFLNQVIAVGATAAMVAGMAGCQNGGSNVEPQPTDTPATTTPDDGGNVDVEPVSEYEVLTHADYFITHAGTGSVMEALYFGVPCVCIPHMDEQVLTANRLKELGCASDVMSKQDVTEERLRAAINELIANPSYR